MKRLLLRLPAFIAALAITLGLLVSAGGAPCAASDGKSCGGMTCDYCLSAGLPGVSACGAMTQAAPARMHQDPLPTLVTALAWFGDRAPRLAGIDLPPDLPPPR